jgi:hypothetical protein
MVSHPVTSDEFLAALSGGQDVADTSRGYQP